MLFAPSNAPGMHWPMIRIIMFYTRWGGAYAFSPKIHVAISVGWMDDLRLYVLFNSIPVISGRCSDDNERLYAMELRLQLR